MNKKSQLLYIVLNYARKDFGSAQNSILGVYTSLKKAYTAGHAKAVEMQGFGFNETCMKLKVVRPNSYNYVGCSAYQMNFLAVYSNKELKDLATKIQDWFRGNRLYIKRCEGDLQF